MATQQTKTRMISLTDRQVQLLGVILEPLLEDGRWASPRYLDQLADDRGLDFHAVLLSMPPGLLNPEEAGRPEPICERLGLTLAGAAVCDAADEIVADAIRAIRYVLEQYDSFRVDKEGVTQPDVTHEQIAEHLGLDELRTLQVGHLLAGEPSIGAQEPQKETGTWRVSPRREIRRLRGFTDLADYLQLRAGMIGWPLHMAPPHRPASETSALAGVDGIEDASGELFDTASDLARIRGALQNDLPTALSSTKNVLETICKRILTLRGHDEPSEDLPQLFKLTQSELGIDAGSLQGGKLATDEIKKLANASLNIASGLGTLRNKFGSAHGQPQPRLLDDHTARFAILSGLAVAEYLLARFGEIVDTERNARIVAPPEPT